MTKMMLRRRRRQTGATAIEYGLIAALIAAVLVTIVTLTGVNLSQVYCDVAGRVGTAGGVANECNGGGDNGGGDNPPVVGDCDENGDYKGDIWWMKTEWDGVQEWDSYPSGASQAMKDSFTAWGYTILVSDVTARDDDGLTGYSMSDYGSNIAPCIPDPDPEVQRPIEICDSAGEQVPVYAYLIESYGDGYKVTRPAGSLWDTHDGSVVPWADQATGEPDWVEWDIYRADDSWVASNYGLGFTTLSTNGPSKWMSQDLGLFSCNPDDPMWDGSNIKAFDPNCDAGGNYIGSHDNWYWRQTDYYEHGEKSIDADGYSWSGYSKPEVWNEPTRAEAGAVLRVVHINYSDWRTYWVPAVHLTYVDADYGLRTDWTGNMYSPFAFVEYENGYAMSTNGSMWEDDLLAGAGFWIPKSTQEPTEYYTEGEAGDLDHTYWFGTPNSDGGILKATPPEESGTVFVDYDSNLCGGGIIG